MNHDTYSNKYISDILAETRSIAMIGASANTSRPSYFALKYLLAKGFDVHPVNPGLAGQTLLGRTVYASLEDVPAPIDMLDIFRNAKVAGELVDHVLSMNDRLGLKVIWMQLGVRNDEAAEKAEAAGLKVVMNRCPKIEYGRLSGEITWAGVNSGVVSSARPKLGREGRQNLVIED